MRKRLLTSLALTSLMTAMASAETSPATTSPAESSRAEFSRKGLWEVYGLGQASAIFNIFESNAGVFGGGFGAGYNISQHFTLNGDFAISYVDWEGGVIRDVFGDEDEPDSTLFMGHISADWNMLKYRVTPLLSASLGFGALSNGTGVALDQTLGVGVRWDASERLFLKAVIRAGAMETTSNRDLDGHGNGWATLGFSLAIGYKF